MAALLPALQYADARVVPIIQDMRLAYCSILKSMMLSHHTHTYPKYAKLLDIAET